MKQLRMMALTMAAIFAVGSSPLVSGTQAQSSNAEQEVLKVRREWLEAYYSGDAATLERIETSDFVVISDRTVENKRMYAGFQMAVKANRWFPKGAANIDIEVRVRVQGDVAVVSGRGWDKIPGRIEEPPQNKKAFTELWVRRDGRWRIMHLHYHQLLPPSAASQTSQSQSSVEQELIRLEHLLSESLIKKDSDTYASYLSDDYTEIRANGRLFTKEQVIQAGKRPGGKMERYDLDDLKVRVYGDTAIVTGHYSRKGTAMSLSGQPFEFDEQGRFSDMWVKKQGRWLCVSNQDTAIATPPAARPQPMASTSSSTFPVGTYSAKSQQGAWALDFKRDGTVTVKMNDFSLAPDIIYTVTNDQLEISAGTTSSMCEGKGTYKWTFDGQALSFQLVSDPHCQPRQSVLTGNKFIKQP